MGLDNGIKHGKKGRELADIAANNPAAEADYNSAYRAFCDFDFPLLADLSLWKDSDIVDVMHLLKLEADIAEKLGLTDLQPNLEQLFIPRIRGDLVVNEAALSSSLAVVRQRVKKIREIVSTSQFVRANVFVFLVKPLFSEVLLGSGTASTSEPIATYVNAPSAPSFPALSTGPFSTDDIPVSDIEKDGVVITLIPFSGSRGEGL